MLSSVILNPGHKDFDAELFGVQVLVCTYSIPELLGIHHHMDILQFVVPCKTGGIEIVFWNVNN